MTAYTDFVKKRMAELKSNPASNPEKMKMIAQEWRGGSPVSKKASTTAKNKATGKGKKGGALVGGALAGGELAGGAVPEPPCACHKKKKGRGAVAMPVSSVMKGGSVGKTTETIYLDNGVPLHPDMVGAGFFSGSLSQVGHDIWTGMKLPFQGIAKAVSSPIGRTALAIAPFVL